MGLWMQVGCYTANAMQLEAGKTVGRADLPCAGEGANGGRIQMLPVGTEVEGAASPYAPMGAPRISYASPPYSGGLALKLAVSALDGNEIPELTVLPLPVVTNETIALCEEGTWEEMAAGCSAFLPSLVPNPGWFASIYSPDTPGDRPGRGAGRPARGLKRLEPLTVRGAALAAAPLRSRPCRETGR